MARNIIAILISVTVGVVFIAFGEFAIQMLYPIGKVPEDPEQITRFMEKIPTINHVSLVINWAFAAIVAATLATWIQGRTDFKAVLGTVGILQLLTYMNLLMLPGHPAWIWISATIMYIPIGYITYRIFKKKHVESNEH